MDAVSRWMLRVMWRVHKLMWDLSGGRVGGRAVGLPVLELVTNGRTSGLQRRVLLTYVDHAGSPSVIGTNAGLDRDPGWVQNLRADPTARIRVGGRWQDVTAGEIDGAERDAVWESAVAASPRYARYASKVTRPVPIFVLRSE